MIALRSLEFNEYFDLQPDQNIPFEWISPMMRDDVVLSGIGTLPFTLPLTDKNRKLCKHFDMVNSRDKNMVVDVALEMIGNHWCLGKLVISLRANVYSAEFSEALKVIDIADKKIGEIVNDTVLIDTTFKRWWAFKPVGTPGIIAIDIFLGYTNVSFSSSTGSNSDKMDDIYTQMNANALISSVFDIRRETQGAEEIIYFECFEDDSIFQDSNIRVGGNFLTFNTSFYGSAKNWAITQRDIIIDKLNANISNVFPDVDYCFPSIKNNEVYGDSNADFNNDHLINYFLYGYLSNSSDRSLATISPQFFLFHVLEKICNYLGLKLGGNLQDIEQIYQRCFIYTNTLLDLKVVSQNPGISFSRVLINAFKQRFESGLCMPDNNIKDLLYCIQNEFMCAIVIRNNELTITTKKSILEDTDIEDWTNKTFKYLDEGKGNFENGFFLKYNNDSGDSYLTERIKDITINRKEDVATFADLPTRNVRNNEIRLVIDENKFYISNIPNANPSYYVNWSFYSLQLEGYKYQEAVKEIDNKVSATINDDLIQDYTTTSGGIRKINVPHIYQKGSSDEFQLGYQKAPLRLLFYWGNKQGLLQTTPAEGDRPAVFSTSADPEETYPFASMGNLDMDGNILGDYTLYYEGPYGLYNKLWKEWLAFKNQAKPFTFKTVLSKAELLQLNILKQKQIKESVFIIDRIRGNIDQKSEFVECTIDIYKK
jgi:hypothetical protein